MQFGDIRNQQDYRDYFKKTLHYKTPSYRFGPENIAMKVPSIQIMYTTEQMESNKLTNDNHGNINASAISYNSLCIQNR